MVLWDERHSRVESGGFENRMSGRENPLTDLLSLVLLVTFATTIFVGGWCVADRHRRLAAFENQLERIREEIATLSLNRDRLRAQGDALANDPLAWEAAVRERLGYIREGEVIVKPSVDSRI